MRRNMSSRLLFSGSGSADDEVPVPSDIENPPHQHRPRMISRTKRFLPFSLSRVPLSTRLLCLLVCCLIYSLHKILGLLHLTVLAILFLLSYFLFKTVPRTDLRPIFFYGDEPSAARVSRINGLGVELLPDGSIYAGEFREGIRNGRGVMKMPGIIMCSYGGDWVEGAYDGYGVEDMAGIGGHVYQGQFLEGKRSEYGLMKYCNGDQYKGQWLGDEPHGRGEHTYADGYSYEGQFKRGMRHGFGVLSHSSRRVLQRHMPGTGYTCAFSNGDTYEGSWHQNQMHGYGVYTGKSNDHEEPIPVAGEWVQGVFKSRMPISDRWIQVTLQAARKGARDWERLGKVEDEVRQAVIDAVNANEGAQVACSRAHSINSLHRFDPRRLRLRLLMLLAGLEKDIGKFWEIHCQS